MTRVGEITKAKLIQIILEDCKHRDCLKDELKKICKTCESFGEWHLDKDWYGNPIEVVDEWKQNLELLESLTIGDLVEKVKETHKL